MPTSTDSSQWLRPRLGIVVTTWSHENGAAYARDLVDLLPGQAPRDQLEPVVFPGLLEGESDIPRVLKHFEDKALDALCLIPGNFTLDHIMPLMAEPTGLPTLLWAIPTQQAWGALVAVQQTVLPFKELGLPFRLVIGKPEDPRVWQRAMPYLQAAAIRRRLRGLRLGIMGWRAQGMSDVVFDELALREAFGVQVVNVGLTRYSRTFSAVPEEEVETAWKETKPKFNIDSLDEGVGKYGVRSYLALKRLVAEEALQAITLECFHDHLGGPCLGFSALNDQGVAAPCENDVLASILMAAGQMLTGQPTFHADIVEADLVENTAILHHCGNMPLMLAADAKPVLKAIRESAGPGAFGPTIKTTMSPGAVTAVNLVGRAGTMRMCALEGTALHFKTEMPGSGALLKLDCNLEKALEHFGNEGYGHHFVVIRGHVSLVVEEWCRQADIAFLRA
jgi:L-fucose isomerase-like protein